MPPEQVPPEKVPRNWLRRRLHESVGTIRGVVAEPRSIGTLLRDGLLRLWRIRGGGFFGLGYVICFVVLEIRMFAGGVDGETDVVSFLVMEVLEFIFRFTVQSFVNGLLAFLWPVFVLDALKGWGILVLGVGWIVFDRWAKPRINAWLPELEGSKENPEDTQSG